MQTVGIAALNPRLNMDYPLRGYSVFSHGLCCGRPSSRPYSYAVGCAVIFNALSMIVHACNVGASGSSPALRPPMRVHVGWYPSGDGSRFCVACVAGDLPVAPTATRWSVGVIFNALSMIVHAGNVGASGSSPALRPAMTYMLRHPRMDRSRFRCACVAGDLPVAPTATRWSVAAICNASSIVHAATRWAAR